MKSLLIATAAVAFTIVAPAIVSADEIDKKTWITVNETILIPGRELPPGKYVIKLDRSPSNRNIVRIFNDREDQLQAQFIAIPARRANTTDETVLTYWETPAGSPPALRLWFAPGDFVGQEFAYPKEMAERLARANNGAKIYYAENDNVGTIDPSGVPVAAASPAPIAAPAADLVAARPAPQSESPVLLAQAQPAPSPVAQQETQPAPANDGFDSSLPSTASPMGWVMIAGFLGLISALAIRLLRTA